MIILFEEWYKNNTNFSNVPRALYPSPIYISYTDTIERGAYAVGMSIPPPSIYKAHFCMGGGYNAAMGLIAGDITQTLYVSISYHKKFFYK